MTALLYRCALCNEIFTPTDEFRAFDLVFIAAGLPRILAAHTCTDGRHGIGDLVGMEQERAEGEETESS